MKRHVGYKGRLAESLGERHRGHHKQSLMAREHESEAMERKHHPHHPFHAVETMDHDARKKHRHHMAAAHHKFMHEHHAKHSRKH